MNRSKVYQVDSLARAIAEKDGLTTKEPMFDGNTTIIALTENDTKVLHQIMEFAASQFELAEKLEIILSGRRLKPAHVI